MTEAAFSRFLLRSLDVLETEHPRGFAHLAACLGRREVWLEVDHDRVVLEGNGSGLAPRSRSQRRAAAYARASTDALSAILCGEISLDQAVLQERILLQGRLPDLVAFYEALQAYFNVAVRCPSFAALLDEYLVASAEAKPGASM